MYFGSFWIIRYEGVSLKRQVMKTGINQFILLNVEAIPSELLIFSPELEPRSFRIRNARTTVMRREMMRWSNSNLW